MLIYAATIKRMEKSWKALEEHFIPKDYQPHCSITVLIPFRNELGNLPNLISDLSAQTFAAENVEFIFINDHSTDGSESYLKNKFENNSGYFIYSLTDTWGKKSALQRGLKESKSKLIVTVDADVRLRKNWLMHIASFHFLQEPLMVVLPVTMRKQRNYFSKLIRMEWMSLMAITGGSIQRNKALMCNGANLCMEREALNEIGGFDLHKEISSGDDMYALVAMKRFGPHCVKYIWSLEAAAEAVAPTAFNDFISQRVRWASKAWQAKDLHILSFGTLLLFTNFSLLFAAFMCFVFSKYLLLFFFLYGIKTTCDYALINSVAKKLNEKIVERDVLLLSLIYPIYVLILPIGGLFYRPNWKGRKIKT